jgi:predicted nucleotidyltransferase
MAEGNYREFLKGDVVRAKKYFYVLRPLLAMRWIKNESGPVPMEFEKLVNACVDSERVRSAISDLLEKKKSGHELDNQPKVPELSEFIEGELETLKNADGFEERAKPNFEKLNELFRDALESVK